MSDINRPKWLDVVLLHAAFTCFAGAVALSIFCASSPFIWPDAGQGRLLMLTWRESVLGLVLFIAGYVLFRLSGINDTKDWRK